MFLTKKWVRVFLLCTFLTLMGTQEAWTAEKTAITWGTTSSTSGTFSYYVVAAKILNAKIPEVNITIRSIGGGVHNTRLLEKREVDMGSADTSTSWQAAQGEGSFQGKPFPDLRLLNLSATNPFQFMKPSRRIPRPVDGDECGAAERGEGGCNPPHPVS